MKGHLLLKDSFAWKQKCHYRVGTTVYLLKSQFMSEHKSTKFVSISFVGFFFCITTFIASFHFPLALHTIIGGRVVVSVKGGGGGGGGLFQCVSEISVSVNGTYFI